MAHKVRRLRGYVNMVPNPLRLTALTGLAPAPRYPPTLLLPPAGRPAPYLASIAGRLRGKARPSGPRVPAEPLKRIVRESLPSTGVARCE